MMLPALLTFSTHLFAAVADRVPVLNVEQVCQGIAVQGGSSFRDPAIAKQKRDCLQSEQEVRDQLVKLWPTFAAANRNACVNEARMGGDSSYTELLTCLEMARDVRNLHKQRDAAPDVAAPRSAR
ncbi:MAG: hypothetical protein WBF58_00900 [Xanthobacteraceae bacterium]